MLVMGILGWLLLVFAGDRTGMALLPGTRGSTVSYLTDRDRNFTVEEAGRLPPEIWRPWSGERYLLSRSREVLWLRIILNNPDDTPMEGVLENDDFFADRADAWVTSGKGLRHSLSGEKVPADEKALSGREVAWSLTVPARDRLEIFLRIDDHVSAFARPVWWPDGKSFHAARLRASLAEGIYLGCLLALLGYNILLWLRLRQADLGFYTLYLGCAAAFMVLARAHLPAMGFAIGSPLLETTLTLAMALNGVFLMQFARVFLEVESRFPHAAKWLKRWSVALLVLTVAMVITAPWLSLLKLTTLTVAVTHAGLLALSLAAWRAGVWQARFFLISFGCLFAGSLPMVTVWFWNSLLRDLGMRGLMIGSALEMLTLSLAVAERFARAQKQLIEETEQRRMIEETYADELEEEVRERTRELRAANADKDRILTVIGHDLRGPLTGLMRSSDLAEGHYSREVTRTSRALLLLIEDLVLWSRLSAGKTAPVTCSAHSLMAPAVALHQAQAENSGVELLLDAPEGIQVMTDLVLVQTLVRNLLDNALKFACGRVTLRARETAHGVRFAVGNDGPALSAEVAARMAAGKDGPLTAAGGMGLRLCREICQALGIRLEAETDTGGETEFAFTLTAVSGIRHFNIRTEITHDRRQ